jgi:hypothetical protein
LFSISCDGCSATAYAGCACPDGHDPTALGHHDTCQLSDIEGLVQCAPGSGCCADDGCDHKPADCTVQHGACPDPAGCKLWRNTRSHVDPDLLAASGLPAQCPGGHHGLGVPGCTPCRALTITFLPTEPLRLQRAVA